MARAQITAFDLDGTLLDGQSGSLILKYLTRRGFIKPRTFLAAVWWGIRYKLHLPLRQAEPRELIFGDLRHLTPQQIDQLMQEFHDDVMVPRYRKAGIEVLRRHVEAGKHVALISATFDQVAQASRRYLGCEVALATFMERDAQGNYTGRVQGEVTAGDEKVVRLRAWANETFGADGWEVVSAYSDHYTDLTMLELATWPNAVNPGPTLRREADRREWPILDWQ